MNHRPPTPDPYSQLDEDDTLSLPLTTMNDDISINNNNNSDDDSSNNSNSTLPPLDDSNNEATSAAARALRARAVRGAMIGMQQSGGNNNPLRSRRILFANYDDEGNDADNINNGNDDGDDGGDVPAANWMSAIDAVNNNNNTATAATADGNSESVNNNNNNNTATTTQRRTTTTRQDLRIPMHLWERMFDTFRNSGGNNNNNNDNMDMLFNLTQPNIEFRKRDTLCCPLCMVRYETVGGSAVLKVVNVDTPGGVNENGDNVNSGSENNNSGNTNANNNSNEEDDSFIEVIPGPEPLESPSQSNASSYSSMPSLEPLELNHNRPSSAGHTPHSSMPSLEHNPNNRPSSVAGITPPLSPLPPLVDPEEGEEGRSLESDPEEGEGRSLESLEPQIDSITIQNLAANAIEPFEHDPNAEEQPLMTILQRQRDAQQREVAILERQRDAQQREVAARRHDAMERNILERQREVQQYRGVRVDRDVIARHFEEAARLIGVLPARRERDDDEQETASINEAPVSANDEAEAAEEGHRDIDDLDDVVLDTLEATERLEVAPQRPQSREEMRRNRVIAQLREEARARRERYEEEETASRNEAPVSANDEAETPDDASHDVVLDALEAMEEETQQRVEAMEQQLAEHRQEMARNREALERNRIAIEAREQREEEAGLETTEEEAVLFEERRQDRAREVLVPNQRISELTIDEQQETARRVAADAVARFVSDEAGIHPIELDAIHAVRAFMSMSESNIEAAEGDRAGDHDVVLDPLEARGQREETTHIQAVEEALAHNHNREEAARQRRGISELPREDQDEAAQRPAAHAIAILSNDNSDIHPIERNATQAVRPALSTSENNIEAVEGNEMRDEEQRDTFHFRATRPVGGPRSLDAHIDSGRIPSTNNNTGGTAPRSVDGGLVDRTDNGTERMQFHLEVRGEIGSVHVHHNVAISEYSGMGGLDSVNLNRRRNDDEDEVSILTENIHMLEGSRVEVDVDDCSEVTIDAALEQNASVLVDRSAAGDRGEAQGAVNIAINDDGDSISTSMPSLRQREVSPTSSDSSDRPIFDTPEEDADHPSLPPLAPRDDSSSEESMPRIIPREVESSSSNDSRTNPYGYDDGDEDDDSLPPLVDRDSATSSPSQFYRPMPPVAPELRLRNSLEARYSEIFTSLQSNAFRRPERPSTASTQQRNNNDGIKYLRDYGAMKVFASATCPICLDDHDVLVALKCGHCLCMEDFRELGGYLASDKDKLLTEENVTVVNEDNAAPQASTRNNERR